MVLQYCHVLLVLPIAGEEAIKPHTSPTQLPLRGRNWKRVVKTNHPHHPHHLCPFLVLPVEGLSSLTCCAIVSQLYARSVCIPCFIVIDLIIRRVRGPLGSTSIVTRFPEYVCTTLPPPSSTQNSSFLQHHYSPVLAKLNSRYMVFPIKVVVRIKSLFFAELDLRFSWKYWCSCLVIVTVKEKKTLSTGEEQIYFRR